MRPDGCRGDACQQPTTISGNQKDNQNEIKTREERRRIRIQKKD
jgi:hypothetical protein